MCTIAKIPCNRVAGLVKFKEIVDVKYVLPPAGAAIAERKLIIKGLRGVKISPERNMSYADAQLVVWASCDEGKELPGKQNPEEIHRGQPNVSMDIVEPMFGY